MDTLKRKSLLLAVFSCCLSHLSLSGQVKAPSPLEPIPTASQLKWQQMAYYAFVHLSLNTYNDMAWGFGDEGPQIFNPTELDCRQWPGNNKESGRKGIILIAPHHSGFCLRPSANTQQDDVAGYAKVGILPN